MYLIINFLIQNLNHALCGLILSFLLTPKYSRTKALFIFIALGFFTFLDRFVNFANPTCLTIAAIISQIILFSFTFIAFRESMFKKLLYCIVILVITTTSEYIAVELYKSFFGPITSLSPDTKEFFIANIFAVSIQLIMHAIFLFICKLQINGKDSFNILYFTIFPTMQFSLLVTVFLFSSEQNPILLTTCMIIALTSNIILLYSILSRNEKKTIQDAYEELEELYALETEYYNELENRHEELAKLRHDYQNQLATLYMLISSGRTEVAKEFATSLKDSLQK